MSMVDLSSFNDILSRLETVADRIEKGAGGAIAGGAANAPADASAADAAGIALAFDTFMSQHAAPIEAAAATVAESELVEATQFFMECLRLLRSIFAATSICRKPKDEEWTKFFGPIVELNQKAERACDKRSDFFNGRKAAADAHGVVMMVTTPSPPAHVQSVLEMMDFNAIKVMQKKNPPETAWINALKTCIKQLIDWCKDNCKLGLDWKVGGQDPVEYFSTTPLGAAPGAAPAAAPAAKAKGKGKGAAPPPPKGGFEKPDPNRFGDGGAPAAPAGGGMAQVFSEIEKFKDGTGGLKKVTDDMKAKNMKDVPVLKAAAPKAAVAKAAAGKFAKGPKGAPSKELVEEQNTWNVKNFDGDNSITLEEAEKHHCIRITDCIRSTIRLGNRVKAITVDNCERVNIITKDVISTVEIVNSDRCQVQTDGKVNMIAIDKCNGANVFLNKESLACEIVTSKSSEMNVTIPDDQGDEYDTIEIPIPEQFVTTIKGRKCHTEVSSLYSS